MGITAGPSYTTEQGFVISPLYLSITNMRFNLLPGGTFQTIFTVQAFKSREDKHLGRAPIPLPSHLELAESFIQSKDFFRKSVFQIGYEAAKVRWAISGYVLNDVFEEGQPGGAEYIYNSTGFNIDGYNSEGFGVDGFNSSGFDNDGYDRDGYNAQGYNRDGYNRLGYDQDGYDRDGYNAQGYDKDGYDREGYDIAGIDKDGNPRPSSLTDQP